MTDRPRALRNSLLLVLFTGGILRFVGLGWWSLWTDEIYTVELIRLANITGQNAPLDQHPPFYYWLLEQWMAGGTSEAWLRLPSAVASFLAIPIFYGLGRALKKSEWGLIAASLWAVAPLAIWYAREVRMYGLATLFWVLSLFFYGRLLQKGSWLDVLGLTVANVGGLYTAYSTLGLLFLEFGCFWVLWVAVGRPIGRLGRWLVGQGLTMAAFWLWLPSFQWQLEQGLRFQWRAPQPFDFIGFSGTLAETLQWGLVLGGVGLLGLIGGSFLIRWQRERVKRVVPALSLILILLFCLITLAGAVPRGLSVRRQLLFAYPILILFVAAAFYQIRRTWLTGTAILFSFVLSLAMILAPAYEDWRGIAHLAEQQTEEGELILLSPDWASHEFRYYFTEEGDRGNAGITPKDLHENSYNLHPGDTVWLILNTHPAMKPYTQEVESWFEQHALPQESYNTAQPFTLIRYTINKQSHSHFAPTHLLI